MVFVRRLFLDGSAVLATPVAMAASRSRGVESPAGRSCRRRCSARRPAARPPTVGRVVGTSHARWEPMTASRGRKLIATIGIDRYAHWPPLRNAVSDAEALRKTRLWARRAPALDGDASGRAIDRNRRVAAGGSGGRLPCVAAIAAGSFLCSHGRSADRAGQQEACMGITRLHLDQRHRVASGLSHTGIVAWSFAVAAAAVGCSLQLRDGWDDADPDEHRRRKVRCACPTRCGINDDPSRRRELQGRWPAGPRGHVVRQHRQSEGTCADALYRRRDLRSLTSKGAE